MLSTTKPPISCSRCWEVTGTARARFRDDHHALRLHRRLRPLPKPARSGKRHAILVPSLTRDQREEVVRKPVERDLRDDRIALVERILNDSSGPARPASSAASTACSHVAGRRLAPRGRPASGTSPATTTNRLGGINEALSHACRRNIQPHAEWSVDTEAGVFARCPNVIAAAAPRGARGRSTCSRRKPAFRRIVCTRSSIVSATKTVRSWCRRCSPVATLAPEYADRCR